MLNVVRRRLSCCAGAIAAALILAACDDPVSRHDQWASWRSYAGHSDSSQYSSLDQINRDNVAELEVAWTYPSGNSDHRSTPLIIDEVMYLVANGGVTALDAATGTERWFSPDSVSASVRGLVYWQSDAGSEQRLLVINGNASSKRDGTHSCDLGPVDMLSLKCTFPVSSVPLHPSYCTIRYTRPIT